MVNEIILQIEEHSETTFHKKHKMMPLKRTGLDNLTTAKKRINAFQKKGKKKKKRLPQMFLFMFSSFQSPW